MCCDDHIHCCSSNQKCDAGLCIQLQKTNVTAKKINKVTCNSEFSCPDNDTCCPGLIPDTYQCCPLTKGVCCGDFLHCCPQNTVCDLEKGKCVGKGFVSEMYDSKKNGILKFDSLKLSLLNPSNLNNVFCPGRGYQCPDGYTCCQLPSGNWGCCPFDKATCCPDKIHCCPHGMKCDTTSMSCFQGNTSIASLQKEIAKPINSDIVCPDNSTCASSATCCKINTERFGCCPYEDAVCCDDLQHCCPSGFVCDTVEKHCVPSSKSTLSNFIKYKKLD